MKQDKITSVIITPTLHPRNIIPKGSFNVYDYPMIPEMAIAYLSGFVPNVLIGATHLGLRAKHLKSKQFQQLQSNLAKVNMYWHDLSGELVPLNPTSKQNEEVQFRKYFLILLGLTFALSWVGFFIHFLILFSMKKLAVSHFERKLFASDLCVRELDANTIEHTLKNIKLAPYRVDGL